MPGPASQTQWYLARDGQQFGPISDAEIAKFVELGHLQPNDLLWREGFPDWRPALVVFPSRGRPLGPPMSRSRPQSGPPGGSRPAAHAGGYDTGLAVDTLDRPMMADPRGYAEADDERKPRRWGRVLVYLLLTALLVAAAGAAYIHRAKLIGMASGLVAAMTLPPAAMAIADSKSLETPPLAGFHAGSPEAIDTALQATALWRVIKREFPDWYGQRIAEAAAQASEGKDDAVIGQLMARKLVELRRQQVANGLSATVERLKTVATAYQESLRRLRDQAPEACGGFIRQGEAEPRIVGLLQGSEHTAHLQAELTAVFEAIAEGRQMPRVHPRPTQAQHQLLASELVKRGWTPDDFRLLSSDQAMTQAPPEKVCQLVFDLFDTRLSLPDAEAQERLLVDSLRPVFAG